MQYRSPFFLVFATALILAPLTVRAVDRAQAELMAGDSNSMSLQSHEGIDCDMQAPPGFAASPGCILAGGVSLPDAHVLSAQLIAVQNLSPLAGTDDPAPAS